MDIRITAFGIAGIGWVCGYALFFTLRRCLPPVAGESIRLREILLLIVTLAGGGVLGAQFTALGGVNYIGPYGLGFFLGVLVNVVSGLVIEILFHWLPQIVGARKE